MTHLKRMLPILAIAALFLSSCNFPFQSGSTPTPAFNFDVTQTEIPVTGGTQIVPWLQANHETPSSEPPAAHPSATLAALPAHSTQPAATAPLPIVIQPTAPLAATVAQPSGGQPLPTDTPSLGLPSATPTFNPVVPVTGSGREQIVSLAALLGSRVIDKNGVDIGQVSDFIANLCEAHLLYAVVRPSAAFNSPAGWNLLIPYEAFTGAGNQGQVDVAGKTLALDTAITNLNGAPLANIPALDMQNPVWDAHVQSYWRQSFRLSGSAGCKIAGNGVIVTSTPTGPGATARPATSTPRPATSVPTSAPTTAPTGAVPPTATPVAPQPTSPLPTLGITVLPPLPTATPPPPAVTSDSPPGNGKPGKTPHVKPTKKPNNGLASPSFFLINDKVSPDQVSGLFAATPTAAVSYRVVYRIGLVSSMLGAPIQDRHGNPAATVRDIAILPQTGALLYLVVTPPGASGRLAAIPVGAVNIRYVRAGGQLQPQLVLLVPPDAIANAPTYDPTTGNSSPIWVSYWRQYMLNP